MPEYTCPECSAVLRSNVAVPPGRKIRCKKCDHAFVPGGELALAEEPPPPPKKKIDDDDDTNPYAVTEEAAGGHAVKFGEVQDKFKRSARGPAMALMVLPTNLLLVQGAITFIVGVVMVVAGMFPLIFTDMEPSEDEYREQAGYILFGLLTFFWGSLVCYGASRMQNLESYTWGMVGAIAGLPAGIFALVMLRNPKVIAGFQETEGALDEDEEEDEEDEEDDDDEEEDDEEDEEEDDDVADKKKRK